jgi:hypothetical protein
MAAIQQLKIKNSTFKTAKPPHFRHLPHFNIQQVNQTLAASVACSSLSKLTPVHEFKNNVLFCELFCT